MIDELKNTMPIMIIGLTILSAILSQVFSNRPKFRDYLSVSITIFAIFLVFPLLNGVLNKEVIEFTLIQVSPGLNICLSVDPAGMLFATLALALWLPATIYSIGYMRGHHESNQSRFYSAFALSIGAAVGVAFSSNLITFVLFYELLSLFTYPLVIHRQTDEAIKAGRKYLTYTLTGGIALVAGTAWIYSLGIEAKFEPGGFINPDEIGHSTSLFLFFLLFFGVSIKAAVMPLHSWLPNAMVAPTPVSALLHAVAVVKAGAFGVLRVLIFVFGATTLTDIGMAPIICVLASITLIAGSMLALRHDNLKRRLAYSTISHLSYIVLGIALLGPLALTGALLHLVGHGVTKITLFFCAGAIDVRTHKQNVSQIAGIGRQMPFTMAAFTLAALSMAGIPPFVLFTSKWFLGSGAVQTGMYFYMFVYMFSGVISAAYLFPIIYRAFWVKSPDFPKFGEASVTIVAPLIFTSILTLAWGLLPNSPFGFFSLIEIVVSIAFEARL